MKTANSPFTGFPEECLKYYRDIEKNNNRTWFHAHKEEFQKYVMTPARAFVTEMAPRLMTISPYIYAEPKVNRSIFRIARDIRRNKDKPPYKTQLAFLFWEGGLPRLEAPGFYVAISAEQVMFGCGIYYFSRETLHSYRDSVVHKRHGEELRAVTKKLAKKGYPLFGQHYKRFPHGSSADDPNAEFLLHNALYAYREEKIPKELHSAQFADYIFAKCVATAPLHEWLVDVVKRIEKT